MILLKKHRSDSSALLTKDAFSFQCLTTKNDEGKIQGPMSPMFVLNTMIKEMEWRFPSKARMVRIHFKDHSILNKVGVPGKYDGTYNDILAICYLYNDKDRCIVICIDMGDSLIPAVIMYTEDKEPFLTSIYNRWNNCDIKLEKEDFMVICQELLNNYQLHFNYTNDELKEITRTP